MKKEELDGEKLVKLLKETPEEELEKMLVEELHENVYELCMKTLKGIECDLKLTGKCKKCYDYTADHFILKYISFKNMLTITDAINAIKSGNFYGEWGLFLCWVSYIVEGDGRFHDDLGRDIKDMVKNSGIPRKIWIKFLDYYFSER